MPGKTLLVLTPNPCPTETSPAVAIASAFSVRGFTHIALVGPDSSTLEKHQDAVLDAIQERGYSCQVRTWTCEVGDPEALGKTLGEVEGFGGLEGVAWDGVGVGGSNGGSEMVEEGAGNAQERVEMTTRALNKTAEWALPLLKERSSDSSPLILVVSDGQLRNDLDPRRSMAEAAKESTLFSSNTEEVHVTLLSLMGELNSDSKTLNLQNLAQKAWELYKQPREDWQKELELSE